MIKKTNNKWFYKDYYNRYIETKQFYNFPARIYKPDEYREIKDRLKLMNKRYNYILKILPIDQRDEFILDYFDDLTFLKSKQTQVLFIDLINDFIELINISYQKHRKQKIKCN